MVWHTGALDQQGAGFGFRTPSDQGDLHVSSTYEGSYWVWRPAGVYVSDWSVSFDTGWFSHRVLRSPYWLVVAILSILPTLWVLLRRISGRRTFA
jgi:hypothetical protein